MAITDELREFAQGCAGGMGGDALRHIADRIDREHRMAMEKVAAEVDEEDRAEPEDAVDWKAEARTRERRCKELIVERDERYIALPLDADGVPIRVGDVMDFLGGMTVSAIGKDDVYFFADNYSDGVYTEAGFHLHHHHAPTVEDVLDEFANAVLGCDNTEDSVQRVIAEYAAKLRLAGDE